MQFVILRQSHQNPGMSFWWYCGVDFSQSLSDMQVGEAVRRQFILPLDGSGCDGCLEIMRWKGQCSGLAPFSY